MIKKLIGHAPLRAVCLACTALLGFSGQVGAAGAEASAAPTITTITTAQRQMAEASKNGVDTRLLTPGAPTSYTVQSGDTLWKIAEVFLKSPWRWPELWGLNLAEVRNPQLIYPGEILNLEINDGKARLSRGGVSSQAIRLSPSIRISEQINAAVPTIPFSSIAPFLFKPIMVDDELFARSGSIFAAKDSRLNVGSGGRLYAKAIPGNAVVGDIFSLYRPGRAVKDPDAVDKNSAGALLGVEAVFLGEARLVSNSAADGVSTLDVTNATQEIGPGDRLLSMPREANFQFAPHAPMSSVKGRVVMLHDARTGTSLLNSAQQSRAYDTEGGPLSIVVINRGASSGLESGHVLQLVRPGKKVEERSSIGYREGVKIAAAQNMPAEKYGTVMVFKTFTNIAYAIVMQASTSVMRGDEIVSAEDH